MMLHVVKRILSPYLSIHRKAQSVDESLHSKNGVNVAVLSGVAILFQCDKDQLLDSKIESTCGKWCDPRFTFRLYLII